VAASGPRPCRTGVVVAKRAAAVRSGSAATPGRYRGIAEDYCDGPSPSKQAQTGHRAPPSKREQFTGRSGRRESELVNHGDRRAGHWGRRPNRSPVMVISAVTQRTSVSAVLAWTSVDVVVRERREDWSGCARSRRPERWSRGRGVSNNVGGSQPQRGGHVAAALGARQRCARSNSERDIHVRLKRSSGEAVQSKRTEGRTKLGKMWKWPMSEGWKV